MTSTPAHDDECGAIDRLHPRTRLLSMLAALVFVTVLHQPGVLIAMLAGAIALVWLAKRPWSELGHRLMHVEGFLLVLLLLLPFTVPGQVLWSFGPISASHEGLARAVTVGLKVNICALTIFALIGGLEPVRIGQAAESLGVPTRFVTLFLLTVRYVSVFRAESSRLTEAMRARAFRPGSNLHTWRTYGNLAGMMLVRSLERAKRVNEAMRCRGFTGRMLAPPQDLAKWQDLAFASLFVGAMAGLLVMEYVA